MGVTYFDQKLGEGILAIKEALENAELNGERTSFERERLHVILYELYKIYDGKL